MAPAMRSWCPLRYFVALSYQMSALSSNGSALIGLIIVLSTTTSTRRPNSDAFTACATAGMSQILHCGFVGDSSSTILVCAFSRAVISPTRDVSTWCVTMPCCVFRNVSSRLEPPYRSLPAMISSPFTSSRLSTSRALMPECTANACAALPMIFARCRSSVVRVGFPLRV